MSSFCSVVLITFTSQISEMPKWFVIVVVFNILELWNEARLGKMWSWIFSIWGP